MLGQKVRDSCGYGGHGRMIRAWLISKTVLKEQIECQNMNLSYVKYINLLKINKFQTVLEVEPQNA